MFQDNTIECYHCPTTHPELARALVMNPKTQTLAVGGRYWIHHTIPFRDGVAGRHQLEAGRGRPYDYYYHWVFPTTYLQYAGRASTSASVDVVGVDKIRFRHLCFLPPDTPEDDAREGQRQLDDATRRSGRTSTSATACRTGTTPASRRPGRAARASPSTCYATSTA